MKTPLARAIATCGGQAALAKAIGVRQQVVWNWIQRGGRVPSDRCARIEAATGVRRWDLRPDDWHLIWPELVGTDGAPAVPVSSATAAATEAEGGDERQAA